MLNQSVTFTATVAVQSPGAGTPTGTVEFMDGKTVLATIKMVGGVATYTTSSLTQGTHSITATYSGDTNNTSSTSAAVSESLLSATTATVKSSNTSVTFGSLLTFTATIANIAPGTGVATGTVKYYDGTTLIGTATIVAGRGDVQAVDALGEGHPRRLRRLLRRRDPPGQHIVDDRSEDSSDAGDLGPG